MRLKTLRIILVVCFLTLGMSLFYIQVLKGNYYYHLSVNNRIRVIPLQAQRGRILDRNGVVLADSRLAFDVTVIPQDIMDKDILFGYLGQVLNIPKKELERRFRQRHQTPFAPVVVAQDIEKRLAMVLEENKFRFPGLYIQETFRRRYPLGEATAHLLGYVGKIDSQKIDKLKNYGYTQQSIVGYSGVEEYYDRYLRGKEGGLQIEVNSRGQQVQLLGIRDAERGKDVQLTVDARMQEAALNALNGRRGAIVIMDIDTGQILCLVSSPSYDPNIFTDAKRRSERGRLFLDPDSPMLDRVIAGQYPPGSVFKIVMSIAGLTEKKVTKDTIFFCPGYYQLGRRKFRCAHVHHEQNIVSAIGESCNVYFYNLGLRLGPELIYKYAKTLGFGRLTHIDLPFEEPGFIPNPRHRLGGRRTGWVKGETLNYSIGQGEVLATPIQIVRMMATVATNGKVFEPHVLLDIQGESFVKTWALKALPLKKSVMHLVHEGMRETEISPHGTARRMDIPGVKVYGKTGTAQTVPGKSNHAWYAGYYRGKRHIAFCVFLEYGGSSYYAVRTTRHLFDDLREKGIL